MSDDVLSDALDLVHLSGALIFRIDVRGPWGVTSNPAFEKFATVLPERANDVIAFHVIVEGDCWLREQDGEWLLARPGDAVVLTHGGAHEIAARPDIETVPFTTLLGARKLLDLRHASFTTGEGPKVSLLCGFLGCDRRAFEPLCASLPGLFSVRLDIGPGSLVDHASRQTMDDTPGAQSVRIRLTELLFMQALRKYVEDLPPDAKGWLAAVRDPVVGRAIRAMHEQPCHGWTVPALAEHVASSRSRLATRFREVLGEPPMHYLTHLRMRLAAHELQRGGHSVAVIAGQVGYDSAAAFQRAFKRHFGVPPGEWRHGPQRRGRQDQGVSLKTVRSGRR